MATKPYLLDLNVLIALTWPQHVHHRRAHAWFDRLKSPWATTPITESGFLRLSTNPAVVGQMVPIIQAVATLQAIRSTRGHIFLPDQSSLAAPGISLERVATSRQIVDAHLVNLAEKSGAVLATIDRGIEELVVPRDRGNLFVLP
ncbi:MAG: TA system VapC family ribonuclease toxin [Microbacteriaceae bacterium]